MVQTNGLGIRSSWPIFANRGLGHACAATREPLDVEQICAILSGRDIRLVVLNACLTAAGNFSDDFSVIASALVRSGIPAVVVNQMPFPNKPTSLFVGELCSKLLNSGDLDQSIIEGQIALYADLATRSQSGLKWGVPALRAGT